MPINRIVKENKNTIELSEHTKKKKNIEVHIIQLRCGIPNSMFIEKVTWNNTKKSEMYRVNSATYKTKANECYLTVAIIMNYVLMR